MKSALAAFEQGAARREWPVLFEGCNAAQMQQGRSRRATVEQSLH